MKGKPGKTVRTGFGNLPAVPSIDRSLCTHCGLCTRVCKSFTIVESSGTPQILPDNGLGCIGCAQCLCVCPSGAISLEGRKIGPESAFPLPPQSDRATPEALGNLMAARRSIREFSDRSVTREDLARILDMAAFSPMGIPPSDVGVSAVLGQSRVQACAEDILGVFARWRKIFNPVTLTLLRPFMGGAEVESFRDFILPATGFMLEQRKKGTDLLFYHAPCVLLFHQSAYTDPVDGVIACTHAMLAAESMGLGTCMIGTVAFAMNQKKGIKVRWGIPAENKVSLAMILGYPAFSYSRGVRRSFASVTFPEP